MILVTLGTQKQQFTRILDYIENSKIKGEIIVQAGHTKYESKKMKIFDFIDYDKMNEYVKKADLIITHGGTGSITGPLKEGKCVIACARKKEYGEHVDDHQEQIVDIFAEEGYILKLDEKTSLDELVKKSKNFKPKKFKSNTDKFIEKLEKKIKEKRTSRRNTLFVILFILIIFLIPIIMFLRPAKDISSIENRELNKFYFPSLKDLLNGKYQDDLENAMEDQMLLSETLKKVSNTINNINRDIASNILFENVEVIPMSKGYCKLGDSDYLIYCPKTFEYFKSGVVKNINTINNLKNKYEDIDFYAYRVITDEDVSNDGFNYEMEEYFKENIDFDYASFTKIKSYSDYKKYYYKSDHHWNYKGSYEGYKEIMYLLDEDILYEPKGTTCFENTYFVGSEASAVGDTSIKDEFCVYDFDYYDLDEKVYGQFAKYGYFEDYAKGNYHTGNYYNHYGNYYGGNYGEVIFSNNEKNNNKNILLIVDSMSNPVNRLIASNYKNSYVVDLRRFETFTGNKFNFNDYVEKYNIDEVLFLGNIRFYSSNEFIPKLG